MDSETLFTPFYRVGIKPCTGYVYVGIYHNELHKGDNGEVEITPEWDWFGDLSVQKVYLKSGILDKLRGITFDMRVDQVIALVQRECDYRNKERLDTIACKIRTREALEKYNKSKQCVSSKFCQRHDD